MPALLFDCDGVLAEPERDAHLPAFNRAFAEAGLPIHWSEDEYGVLLRISGGKERVASVLTPGLAGVPDDPDGRGAWVAAFHRRKSVIFREIVASEGLAG